MYSTCVFIYFFGKYQIRYVPTIIILFICRYLSTIKRIYTQIPIKNQVHLQTKLFAGIHTYLCACEVYTYETKYDVHKVPKKRSPEFIYI